MPGKKVEEELVQEKCHINSHCVHLSPTNSDRCREEILTVFSFMMFIFLKNRAANFGLHH